MVSVSFAGLLVNTSTFELSPDKWYPRKSSQPPESLPGRVCAVAVASPRNDTHTVTPDYPEVESAGADQPDGLSEQVALASLEIASRLCDVQVAGSHRVSHGGNGESSMVVRIQCSHPDSTHPERERFTLDDNPAPLARGGVAIRVLCYASLTSRPPGDLHRLIVLQTSSDDVVWPATVT